MVEEMVGIGLDKGSVIVQTVAIFPSNSTVSSQNVKQALENDTLSFGSTTLEHDTDSLEVNGEGGLKNQIHTPYFA